MPPKKNKSKPTKKRVNKKTAIKKIGGKKDHVNIQNVRTDNININVGTSKTTQPRRVINGSTKNIQHASAPYPVYNRAIPSGTPTVINNIPPQLQTHNNYNQRDLQNTKDEILKRLNAPLAIEYNPKRI